MKIKVAGNSKWTLHTKTEKINEYLMIVYVSCK